MPIQFTHSTRSLVLHRFSIIFSFVIVEVMQRDTNEWKKNKPHSMNMHFIDDNFIIDPMISVVLSAWLKWTQLIFPLIEHYAFAKPQPIRMPVFCVCCRQNMYSHWNMCVCAYDGKFVAGIFYHAAAFKHLKYISNLSHFFFRSFSHKSIYGKWKIFIIISFANRVQLTPLAFHNIESFECLNKNRFIYRVCCIMLYIHLNAEQKKN